jgi:hypothetical protein
MLVVVEGERDLAAKMKMKIVLEMVEMERFRLSLEQILFTLGAVVVLLETLTLKELVVLAVGGAGQMELVKTVSIKGVRVAGLEEIKAARGVRVLSSYDTKSERPR